VENNKNNNILDAPLWREIASKVPSMCGIDLLNRGG
jgi:hypothetical protein